MSVNLDNPYSAFNRKVRRILAERGIEYTPEGLVEERRKLFNTLRKAMLKQGFVLPEDDGELLKQLKVMSEEGDFSNGD